MPTFGFSAYLKLVCLNSKPQRQEIRHRLAPKDGGGYDFHRSLRLLAQRHLLNGESLLELTPSIKQISQEAERNSVIYGLQKLSNWRSMHTGPVISFDSATFNSNDGIFKVNFIPDFGIELGGKRTAIHIWNTKRPELEKRFVYGALALFPSKYKEMAKRPDDLAVLSLRDERLYRLSDVGDMTAFGLAVAKAIENLFESEAQEPGLPASLPGPSPFTPPPSVP